MVKQSRSIYLSAVAVNSTESEIKNEFLIDMLASQTLGKKISDMLLSSIESIKIKSN